MSAQVLNSKQTEELIELDRIVENPASSKAQLAEAYLSYSEILYVLSFDTIIPFCEKAIDYVNEGLKANPDSLELNSLYKTLAGAYNNMGYAYDKSPGGIPKAITYYEKSLEIKNKIGNEKGVASTLHNLASVYLSQGDVAHAIEVYHKALKIREKISDKKGMSISLSDIGGLYQSQKNYKEAFKYLFKSLKLREELGDKFQLIYSLSGIAIALHHQAQELSINSIEKDSLLAEALNYELRSLAYAKEIQDLTKTSNSLNNVGLIFASKGDTVKALKYLYQAFDIRIKSGNEMQNLGSLINIGLILLEKGDLKKAEEYAEKSYILAKKLNQPSLIKVATNFLFKVYEKQGKHKLALEMYKLHITMRDSINNESTQKATIQQQAKYEYEKQKAIDDAENDKLVAIEKEEKAKQKIITFATAGGLGLVVIFLIFVFNRLQVTKKQKIVIETQKQEVEQQKEVVELAHHELEEKNQEIMDSITYAKRIQNAILPPLKVVKAYLQESFILYKPKDIVAGDFYWMGAVKNKVLFAAADCTGHGVPGAMVSVVCNNALNRSVREYGLTDPGEILNKTREIVIEEFEKSDEDVQDGMDIALCSLKGSTLQYAGAHNPLWIVRKSSDDSESSDDFVILETKANKQPIGKYDNLKPYTTHSFELQKGDSIYIFSDGFVDQFGGDKGKKFKAKAFRTLLLSIQDKSMEEQHVIIDNAFENWRGDLEQIDDVCVIGVRI